MTIKVNENEDGTLTIEWDENDPSESLFNTWTEEDFVRAIRESVELHETGGKERSSSCEPPPQSDAPN